MYLIEGIHLSIERGNLQQPDEEAIYMYITMRDEGRKKEASKVKQARSYNYIIYTQVCMYIYNVYVPEDHLESEGFDVLPALHSATQVA